MQQEQERPIAYLIGDTETTGLPPSYRACEVAWIEIDPVSLEIVYEVDQLIDPEMPIPPAVTAIHGISDEMVANEPTMDEFKTMILGDRYADRDVCFIAHNATFDVPLVKDLFTITNTVCTLTWARRLFPDAPKHKLEVLRQFFGYPEGEAHRALADVYTTRRILRDLLNARNMTLEQFARNGEHTVHVMPYGQFKGRLLKTLPAQYLIWLWNREQLEENMRNSVKEALKIHGIKTVKNNPIIIEVDR